MNQSPFDGLFTALITPFLSDEKLDESGLRALLRYQLSASVDGITLLGSTGETSTISYDERDQMIEIAAEELEDKALLMVGCGSPSTATTVSMAKKAELHGADALLVVTPYFVKPTQEGIFRHFKAVTEETSLPIIVYNIQGRCGTNIETSTLERLAELPSILGVKEASGSIMQMSDVIERVHRKRPDFRVVSGDDAMTLPLMALGGHGIISVISNLVPRAMKRLVEYAKTDLVAAREEHYLLRPLNTAAFIESNPIPIKRLMQLAGMPSGSCRLPLCDLSPASEAIIQKLYKNLPQILCQEISDFQKLPKVIYSRKSESEDELFKSSTLTPSFSH